jgi:hypothetical protein
MQLEMLHMLVEEGRRMNQDGGGGGGGGGWGVCISEVEGRSDRRRRSRRFATYIQTNKQTNKQPLYNLSSSSSTKESQLQDQ